MDELIKSVDIVNNQAGYTYDQVLMAKEFCNEFVEKNFKLWLHFFEYFQNEQNPEVVRFWFINALTEIIQKKFKLFDPNEKQAFLTIALNAVAVYPSAILSRYFSLNKYSQLIANIYENLCQEVCPMLFDEMIDKIILPSQQQNAELYYAYCQLLVESIQELYHQMKNYKNEQFPQQFKIRKCFSQNERSLEFMIFLVSDDLTPNFLKAKILLLFNKMIKTFDFDHQKQQQFYPIALQQINSTDLSIVVNSIKFLQAYFQNNISFEDQLQIVGKIFEMLPLWRVQLDLSIFKAISKLFTKVISSWSSMVYQEQSQRNFKKNRFAYQSAFGEESHEKFSNEEDDEEGKYSKHMIKKYEIMQMRKHQMMNGQSIGQVNNSEEIKEEAPQGEQPLTPKQIQILEIFDQIFELSMFLFQQENLKIQIIICEQFMQYLQMIIRSKSDRFSNQMSQMIQLALSRLRYPDWYDIQKKTTDNEDEEKFKELRDELTSFLQAIINKDNYVEGFVQHIDQRIAILTAQAAPPDIRELDIIFTLISLLISQKRQEFKLNEVVQRYQHLLFSEEICQKKYIIFADIVLDIYQLLKFENLSQEQIKSIICYLFSQNGILSNNNQLQQQACSIFLREYKQHHNSHFLPFIADLMQLIGERIIQNIGTMVQSKDKASGQIFQVLGSLLSDESIDINLRLANEQVYVQKVYYTFKEHFHDANKQRFLIGVLNSIQKGFKATIEEVIKNVFLELLDALMQNVVNQEFIADDSIACIAVDMFQERLSIFKEKNFLIMKQYIQQMCENCSFKVQAAYFRTWNAFVLNSDSQREICQFVFENFDVLQQYMEGYLKIVASVRVEADQQKSEIQEEVIKLLKEATTLDYLFLLTKGDQMFIQYIQFLNELYEKSFSAKLKMEVLGLITHIFIQFFNYKDEEFVYKQNHYRNKLEYNPAYTNMIVSDEVIHFMKQYLEYVAINYSSLITKFGSDTNDKIFSQIVILQDIALKTLEPEFKERMRFKMKNEVKILYYYVIENLKILENYKVGKIGKQDLQKTYVKLMNQHLEEKILKSHDENH